MKKKIISIVLLLFVSIVYFSCTNTNSANEQNSSDSDSIEVTSEQNDETAEIAESVQEISLEIANTDEISLDLEDIKNKTKKIDKFAWNQIAVDELTKIDEVFKEKYLTDFNLPTTFELDGEWNLEYYFYSHIIIPKAFLFTIVAANTDMDIYNVFLLSVNYENGHIIDCREMALSSDYEGYTDKFKIIVQPDKPLIIVYRDYQYRNEESNLFTESKTFHWKVADDLTLTEELANEIDHIGSMEKLLCEFEYDFSMSIPNMYSNEEVDPAESNALYKSFNETMNEEIIEYTIAGLWGISGELFGNTITFEYDTMNFTIDSVCIAYENAIFFNEDGSGGTWAEGVSEITDYIKLENTNFFDYQIPNENELPAEPYLAQEAIDAADAKLDENEMLNYSIWTNNVAILVVYKSHGKDAHKVISFNYEYGD